MKNTNIRKIEANSIIVLLSCLGKTKTSTHNSQKIKVIRESSRKNIQHSSTTERTIYRTKKCQNQTSDSGARNTLMSKLNNNFLWLRLKSKTLLLASLVTFQAFPVTPRKKHHDHKFKVNLVGKIIIFIYFC